MNKALINEVIALEVMGWVVHEASTSSYKNSDNEVIPNFNPAGDMNSSMTLIKHLAIENKLYASVEVSNRGFHCMLTDLKGDFLGHSYNYNPSLAVCMTILAHFQLTQSAFPEPTI
jgi:hypothetical protein